MLLYCSQRLSEALEIYADVADGTEISLLGRITVEDKVPTLNDIKLIPQQGDSSATHIKMEDLVDFVGTLGEDAQNWRCWIHTHPGRARPSYSPEDDDTLGLLAQIPGWFLGVVLNEAGLDSRVYLAQNDPFPILEPVGTLAVLSALTSDEKDAILQDVASNVKPPEKKANANKRGGGRHNNEPKAIVVARKHAQMPFDMDETEADQLIWDAAAQMGPPKKHKDAFLFQQGDKTLVWAIWDYKKNEVRKVAEVNLAKVAKRVVEEARQAAINSDDPPYGSLPEDDLPIDGLPLIDGEVSPDGGDAISLEEFLKQEQALAPSTTRPGPVSEDEGD